jgi:glycine oxidase
MNVVVIGAGVAGLTCAVELASRGCAVEVFERAEYLGPHNCSWYAGGMLAPWCELEGAEPAIAKLGERSITWWRDKVPSILQQQGSMVIAHERDRAELAHFARRTERYQWLDGAIIGEIEPDLAGRFDKALLFAGEAHLDPRAALQSLLQLLIKLGGSIQFNSDVNAEQFKDRHVIDCTGLAASHTLHDLRGVRGEMLLVRSHEVKLNRPIRVLHPRIPLYIVPRGDGLFMLGATMIESNDASRITTRSMLELLNAAYAMHPAFGESEIVEMGAQVRPACPDNLPCIRRYGNVMYVNGLYRHGYLVSPALAQCVADILLYGQINWEGRNEHSRQWQEA